MFNVGEDRFVDDGFIMSEMEKLVPCFDKAKDVKRDEQSKNRDFRLWSSSLEKAYGDYMSNDAYSKVKEIIEQSMDRGKDRILFHEANSTPEFWEQTRIIAGVNVAEPLLKCAKSVEGWSFYQKLKSNQ